MTANGPAGGLLVVFGLGFLALAPWLGRHPEVFARRNFPFNVLNDQSTPRGWVVAVAFGGFGVALVALGIAALLADT